MTAPRKLTVLAAGAHPDDIEFMMAGTLLRLRDRGLGIGDRGTADAGPRPPTPDTRVSIHMWNIANGMCGTATHSRDEIIALRWGEAQAAAAVAGAVMHPPIGDDLAVFFEPTALAKAAALIRQIQPDIILTQSPADYMEDHQNATRLIVTAAFVRGMPNFATDPPTPPWPGETVIYHALPHGLRDELRRRIQPGQYVNIAPVLATKRRMLAAHRTQKEWLDVSQGMDAYLNEMETMARQVGQMSGQFELAEGWRRHSHLGFARTDSFDPLAEALLRGVLDRPGVQRALG